MPDVSAEAESARRPDVSDAVRVQILATEHWGQLATRSMIWNEVFARAGMFLTTLSAAVVAIALVAQASDFGPEFRLFALLVLPVVLFLGIATHIRLGATLQQDVWTVVGMNRLRHAYLQIAPDLEPFILNSQYDDLPGLLQSSGQYTDIRPGMAISSTPTIVSVINAVIAGVIVALLLDLAFGNMVVSTVSGIGVGLLVTAYLAGVLPYRDIRRLTTEYVPRFPRDTAPPGAADSGSSTASSG